MGVIAIPNTFSSNTTISSSQVNSNFSTIYSEFNGSIAAANLATDSVTTAKIADSNVTTAKIADNAVTSAKVSGIAYNTTTTLSNPYKFRAYRNAAANTGNNAYALVACDTETFDTNNNHSAGVYTAPVTGYYYFTGQINISMGAENRVTIVALFKNGVQCSTGSDIFGSTGTNTGLVVSDLISLTAGDTVDMRAYCSATKALNVGSTSQNFFSGFLVSRT